MTRCHFKTVLVGFVLSLVFVVSGFGTSPVYATEYKTYLLVSPPTQTLGKLEPGQSYSGEFLVKNIGTEKFDFKVYATPYYQEGEQGSSVYTVSNHYTYLSEWITFDAENGHLEPKEEKKIKYFVRVPETAVGGAQNAAIMVETEDSADANQTVSATTRVAVLLFSQVNGEINPCGKIIEKDIPGFLLNPPISAFGRVENCGNIDLNVQYVISIKPIFSDKEIYTNRDNPRILATLPETRRYTSLEWENTPGIGMYNVRLEITYNGKTEVIDKLVVVCPLWLIILIIVFAGSLIFWLISRNRSRKLNNKENKGKVEE